MAALPSLADSPVPEWVRKNGEIFRTPPSGMDLSKRSRRRFLEAGYMVEPKLEGKRAAAVGAATTKAEMSEENGQGAINPPTFLPPASYYKDVQNHANIAATMLATARHQVGFKPSLAGQDITGQQMDEFVMKYYQWIMELDNYWPYLDMKGSQVLALRFHSGNQNLIDEDVSRLLAYFHGLNDDVVRAWRQSLTNMVKGASVYVNQQGVTVSSVSFQMDILDTSGNRDPIQPLTFGRSVQSDPPNGRHDSLLTSATTYLIDSSAIIAAADDFAKNGVTIFGAREYRDFVRSGALW